MSPLVVPFILALLIALVVIFIWTHLRPLTPTEVSVLASKRRNREIGAYFSFSGATLRPDLAFKRGMAPDGKFYGVRVSLHDFPPVVASWLKGKKHEWMVVGMEKSKEVSLVWTNKGEDKTRVCLAMPFDRIAGIAASNGYVSVLIFHNHPNSNPEMYSCSQPSEVDLNSSALRAKRLNGHGINLVEFVCERGVAYKYRQSPANSFLPIESFAGTLRGQNGVSKGKNLSLHMERIF